MRGLFSLGDAGSPAVFDKASREGVSCLPPLFGIAAVAGEGVEEGVNLEQAIEHQATLTFEEGVAWLQSLPDDERINLAEQAAATQAALRKERQLLFYRPVSKEAEKFHASTAQQRVALGGNGSSKTEINLADMVIAMTGIVPYSLESVYPKQKLRPPIATRLIVESLTNTWESSIKPKLQWDHWTGLPDGKRGHWGWIPRHMLIKGKWEESWSEKYRTLTLTNGSTCQVMSGDQDVSDFASASVHDIRIDEGKKHALYRENLMRLREGGYISMAMTPPDDESASWAAAWVFDDLYEKGLPGPNKDPDIDSFTLFTEDNPYLAEDFISKTGKGLSPKQKEVRFHGKFMHLGGRGFPVYTDRPQWWCFTCNDIMINVDGKCTNCQNKDGVVFQHTVDSEKEGEWIYTCPIVYLLDPHPRKEHMMMWVAVTPWDDWVAIKEMLIDAEPEIIRDKVFDFEKQFDLNIAERIIDPNMGRSPAHNAGRRQITVAEEFAAVGIRCNDSVSDSFNVGNNRVKVMLKPDSKTRQPRLRVFENCVKTNFQMMHVSFDEWARFTSDERDPKQTWRPLNDDFPKLFIYLANSNVTYAGLKMGGQVLGRGKRKGAY